MKVIISRDVKFDDNTFTEMKRLNDKMNESDHDHESESDDDKENESVYQNNNDS